jgi:hypothetical protein
MEQKTRIFITLCVAGALGIIQGSVAAEPVSSGIPAQADVWNSLEVAKLLVSLLVPILLLVLGFFFDRRLKEIEQENEKSNRQREEAFQRQRDETERRHEPHIGFTIACTFFGPDHGWYIAEFVIFAKNTSLVRHKFREILLRVRGFKKDETPGLWEGHGERMEFRHPLLKTNLIPPDWNYIFVEPGVTQQISFISRIPDDVLYIVAKAEFNYDEYTPHTIERMFEVRAINAHAQPLNTAA